MKRAKLGAYLLMVFVFKSVAVQPRCKPLYHLRHNLENVSLVLSTATFDAVLINGEPDNPIRMTVSHGS